MRIELNFIVVNLICRSTTPGCNMQCGVSKLDVTSHQCGPYGDDETVVPLRECDRDIQAHLRFNHLSNDNRLKSEAHLILARVGQFHDGDLNTMTVCPTHRNCLGIKWRASSQKCQVPVGSNRYVQSVGLCFILKKFILILRYLLSFEL